MSLSLLSFLCLFSVPLFLASPSPTLVNRRASHRVIPPYQGKKNPCHTAARGPSDQQNLPAVTEQTIEKWSGGRLAACGSGDRSPALLEKEKRKVQADRMPCVMFFPLFPRFPSTPPPPPPLLPSSFLFSSGSYPTSGLCTCRRCQLLARHGSQFLRRWRKRKQCQIL
jgi:hypothetical protein